MRRLSRREGGGGEGGGRGEEGCLGGSAASDRLSTDEVVQRSGEMATFNPHHQQEAEPQEKRPVNILRRVE